MESYTCSTALRLESAKSGGLCALGRGADDYLVFEVSAAGGADPGSGSSW